MKCNKGGVTGKTEVAGTRTTQQRIVRRCVEQVDSLGLRPRDQKVAYTGRCVRWNVVWRFPACYHMWLPTLVLVFILLPHMCSSDFLRSDFEEQLRMVQMLQQLIGVVSRSAPPCVWRLFSAAFCVCFSKSADTISGTPQKQRPADNVALPNKCN